MKNKYVITAIALAVIFVVFLISRKPQKEIAPSIAPQEVVTPVPHKAITERPRLSINAIKRTDETEKTSPPAVSGNEAEYAAKSTKAQNVKASGSVNAVSGSAGSRDEAPAPSAQKEPEMLLPQSVVGGVYRGASSIGGGSPGGGGSGPAPANAVPPVDAVAKLIKKANDERNEYRNAVAAIDAERAANRDELRKEAENVPLAADTTAGQPAAGGTGATSTPAQGGGQNTGTTTSTPASGGAPNTGPSKLAY